MNPFNSNRSIVLLFDFVHILKSIRNNWLNQHDYNRTFLYPNFEDLTQVNRALFEDIRLLYRSEQISVAKLAHRLTAKSCWSNLERQSVSLAHRVFNESTAAALTIQDYPRLKFKTSTADFVTIISNIWKIFIINTPNKGIRLNDALKWPSNNVIDAIQTVWSTFRKIENSSELWKDFLIGPSLPIFVELTVILVELQQSETWRYTCPGCGVIGWKILRKLATVTSNCILSNKTKNMNVLKASCTDNVRKIKKLKSN